MPTQRECVCCRDQPEAENKMQARILSLYCIGRSKWKNNFLCKLLYILKRRFNKAVSSYFLPRLFVFSFYLLAVTRRNFLYHCKRRIFDSLFKPSGARNCDSRLPVLQQMALTFTNAESARVYYGYKMTLNNNN